jgi:hypothetical protein
VRILSGFLFFLGILALYFGLMMFLMLEANQADYRAALLLDGGSVLIGELLLCASGWCWFRPKQASVHMLMFTLAGSGLMFFVVVGIVNRTF